VILTALELDLFTAIQTRRHRRAGRGHRRRRGARHGNAAQSRWLRSTWCGSREPCSTTRPVAARFSHSGIARQRAHGDDAYGAVVAPLVRPHRVRANGHDGPGRRTRRGGHRSLHRRHAQQRAATGGAVSRGGRRGGQPHVGCGRRVGGLRPSRSPRPTPSCMSKSSTSRRCWPSPSGISANEPPRPHLDPCGRSAHDEFGGGYDLVLISAICHNAVGGRESKPAARSFRALTQSGRVAIQDFLLRAD